LGEAEDDAEGEAEGEAVDDAGSGVAEADTSGAEDLMEGTAAELSTAGAEATVAGLLSSHPASSEHTHVDAINVVR